MKSIINRFLSNLKWLLLRRKLGSYKSKVYISSKVTMKYPECIHFGCNVGIGKMTCFLPVKQYAGVRYNPQIIIGDNCMIGIRNSFACIDRIQIGNNVLFAGYVHITDHSHGYEDITRPIAKQTLISKGMVVVEDDCWLGFGSEILFGVHIGKHCIVAARAVVTKDVPAYSIVAGNPARIVKQYNFEKQQWEKII